MQVIAKKNIIDWPPLSGAFRLHNNRCSIKWYFRSIHFDPWSFQQAQHIREKKTTISISKNKRSNHETVSHVFCTFPFFTGDSLEKISIKSACACKMYPIKNYSNDTTIQMHGFNLLFPFHRNQKRSWSMDAIARHTHTQTHRGKACGPRFIFVFFLLPLDRCGCKTARIR